MIAANFLYTNVWLVVFLMSLAQLGYGIAYACTPPCTQIRSSTLNGRPEERYRWISGLQNVPLKVGVMLRGISISACLAIAHFTPGMDASQATVELQKASA